LINSNTSFGKLKSVIVGRELIPPKRITDVTFRAFYKEAISQSVYYDFGDYYVNLDLIQRRNEELDKLADVLAAQGIDVKRPDPVETIEIFKTPTFKSELSSASNVRDVTLVYNDAIVETPTFVRNRYFENLSLYDVYDEAYRAGGKWIRCPHTRLTEERMDLTNWRNERDYDNFDHTQYDMAIDGAQFLRIGRDVIVNVSSYNHYLGYKWVESLFPDSEFHLLKGMADNHIDGIINALCPGKFLVDPKYPNVRELLPKKFQDWEFIYPEDLSENIDITGMTNIDIRLASSRGMDINVLSIDEKTVVVNERAHGVKDALDKNGFNVIEVTLENGEIFGGGIHCSTLDLERVDEYKFY